MSLFKNANEFIQYFDIKCDQKQILSYLISNVPKEDEYVNVIIKYINDDHSYKNWYAMELLVSIGSEYALEKCIEYKILEKHIMPLYWKFSHLHKVQEYMFQAVIKNKYIGDKCLYKPLDILIKHIDNQNTRKLLCDIYYHYYKQSYPSEGFCYIILFNLKDYRHDGLVNNIFNHALNSGNICLTNKVEQILLGSQIKQQIYNKIDVRLLNQYVDNHKYDHLLYYCKNNTKLISIVEEKVQKIIDHAEKNFILSRSDKKDVCYGLNPLGGFSDFTYQDYFDALICLSLIAKHTKDKVIFSTIFDFINTVIKTDKYKGNYFKGDIEVALDIFYTMSKNELYGNTVTEKNDKNHIFSRFKLHSNETTSHNIIKDKILSLIYFYDICTNDEKEYLRLEISNYYNTEYSWMKPYYIVDEERMRNII